MKLLWVNIWELLSLSKGVLLYNKMWSNIAYLGKSKGKLLSLNLEYRFFINRCYQNW